jgi:hypothetical protein
MQFLALFGVPVMYMWQLLQVAVESGVFAAPHVSVQRWGQRLLQYSLLAHAQYSMVIAVVC